MPLKEISKPIEIYLKEFDKFYKNSLRSKVFLLDVVIKYILRQKGKKIRPLLVLLSAEACGGVNRRSYIAASMIELLHTATLVHDDVVDEADERRGFPSINSVWKNKISVLAGDYILSQGLIIANENDEFGFLKATSRAVKRMSEGELFQIYKSKSLNIKEEEYFRIISDKTASLISVCCEIGALSSSNDENIQIAMRDFGEYVGIIFQIKDDLFDYTSTHKKIGKPIGNDILEKKLTLPVIYALSKATKTESKSIIKLIRSLKLNDDSNEEKTKIVTEFVNKFGGVDYSIKIANEYRLKALNALSILPDNQSKNSLILFVDFALNRDS
ncbi:MAG: polyprenyl synthetase family protein [Chlorobiota bacterium]|nr:MAG: polyprenyl synthetase family protein [Chlorobiota bacterium]